MNLKTIHTTHANHWVRVTSFSPTLKKSLADFQGNQLFGFLYIDHQAGITLEVVQLYDEVDGAIQFQTSPKDKNLRVICRLGQLIDGDNLQVLSQDEIEKYNLQLEISLDVYDRTDLDVFRNTEAFHEFRADGYPDDVQVMLPPIDGLQPELMWGRVEQYDEETKVIRCNLLNKPQQNFGLGIDDTVNATIETIEGNSYIICHIAEIPNSKKPKKWWKFW